MMSSVLEIGTRLITSSVVVAGTVRVEVTKPGADTRTTREVVEVASVKRPSLPVDAAVVPSTWTVAPEIARAFRAFVTRPFTPVPWTGPTVPEVG